jgi:prepilin-type processing-associated H-X9-DG protein
MNAGSFLWYHDASVNQGLYPRRDWGRQQPSRIIYLMESNEFGINEVHTLDAYSQTFNTWPVGGVLFNPTSRHQNVTRGNITYADGHVAVMEDDYTDREFPFVWF